MGYLMNFVNSLLDMVGNVLWAVILLVVALIAASLVKKLVKKLVKLVNVEKWLNKVGVDGKSVDGAITFIEKLAYFVTFMLFLPGVLDKLGMQSVSSPITGMVNSFMGFIPNMIAAGLVLAIGIFVAGIIRQLLIPVLKLVKVDELQKRAGIEPTQNTSFSVIIANIVYGLIILIVITSALDVLGVATISNPANAVVSEIFSTIPDVIAAIVIVLIGVFIAQLVGKLLEALLASVGADTLIEKITKNEENKIVLSKILGEIVKYVLIIIFVVQGIDVLGLTALNIVGTGIIAYLPSLIATVIIFGIGIFAGKVASDAIVKNFPEAKLAAIIGKVVIYILTAFLCLNQLGVASSIVGTAFTVIITSVGVAFAIAFGVGGRQFAANMLEKLEKKLDNDKK